MIKVSDYVADFIARQGVSHVYMVTGGGAMHLNDSIGGHAGYTTIPMHHEQSAAMAAEGHARIAGGLGVVQVTTGPGGTNAVTGVAGAWIDSIPMLVISGQVTLDTTIGNTRLRQLGVQEIDILAMVRPITKYAVMVTEPKMIRYHLEKAVHYALGDRQGPVWLDIPLDVQGARIDADALIGYEPEPPTRKRAAAYLTDRVEHCVEMLNAAERPLIISGYGVRLAHAEAEFLALVERLRVPVVTSWNSADLMGQDHDCFAGRAGLFGDRGGNFAVQNADLLLVIGSRMSIPQIGHNAALFARHARQIIVDIDENELTKPTLRPDLPIVADAKAFLNRLLERSNAVHPRPEQAAWLARCRDWQARYPVVTDENRNLPEKVNSYHFIERLSQTLGPDAVIVTDMGTSFTCTMQTFAVKHGQRLFTSSGLASMGFGLPGAIGACLAAGGRRTVCVSGDGGMMFNIQELQTVVQLRLPMSIFVLDNQGYLTMKLMQRNHFGRYVGSEPGSGVSCPDFVKVARAFGLEAVRIAGVEDLDRHLERVVNADGPVLCQVEMPELQALEPRVQTRKDDQGRFVLTPIEDMYPFLDREEFQANMLVPPPGA